MVLKSNLPRAFTPSSFYKIRSNRVTSRDFSFFVQLYLIFTEVVWIVVSRLFNKSANLGTTKIHFWLLWSRNVHVRKILGTFYVLHRQNKFCQFEITKIS